MDVFLNRHPNGKSHGLIIFSNILKERPITLPEEYKYLAPSSSGNFKGINDIEKNNKAYIFRFENKSLQTIFWIDND